MANSSDSGSVVDRLLDLATDEVQKTGEHVQIIEDCLRGNLQTGTRGLIERMNAIEKSCRQNHGNDQRLQQSQQIQMDTNRMEAPRRSEVIWTVDKIISAIATGVAVLIASFGALTATCNRRDISRDNARWHRPAHVQPDTAARDTAGP